MRNANVTVHLEENFESWNSKKESWLIERVAELAGCTVDEIRVAGRRKGCVLLYLVLPKEAAARLEREFKSGLNPDKFTSDYAKEVVKEIIEEFDVVSVRADIVRASTYVSTTPKRQPPLFVLVHGWTGSRDSFGVLPDILEKKFNCQVEVPEYKTNFRKGADPIFILGGQLSTFINNRTFQAPRQVAVIGHSMGGVVLRASLIESLRDRSRHYAKYVNLVTTIASPLGGTWLGTLADHIPGDFQVMKQAAELSVQSPTLAQTNQWWHHWVGENRRLEGRIRSIYSYDDKVVPINSAIGQDPNSVCIPEVGHSDIVKPKNEGDEIVLTLLRFATQADIKPFEEDQTTTNKTQVETVR